MFIIKKQTAVAGKGRGRKCVMSDREVNGKQAKGEIWAAGRATTYPFPGSSSLSTSAMRVRLEDEDHHSWNCDLFLSCLICFEEFLNYLENILFYSAFIRRRHCQTCTVDMEVLHITYTSE